MHGNILRHLAAFIVFVRHVLIAMDLAGNTDISIKSRTHHHVLVAFYMGGTVAIIMHAINPPCISLIQLLTLPDGVNLGVQLNTQFVNHGNFSEHPRRLADYIKSRQIFQSAARLYAAITCPTKSFTQAYSPSIRTLEN